MTSIKLHKDKGVNPVLAYCPRCHQESVEILLLGANDGIYECLYCGKKYIGRPSHNKCQTKGCSGSFKKIGIVSEHDRLPALDICDKCKQDIKEQKEEVAKGGVYWKCDKCHNSGVIKVSSDFAAEVRKIHNIQAPDPCGIDFTDDADTMCPVCSGVVESK